jgi:hypothetical protein
MWPIAAVAFELGPRAQHAVRGIRRWRSQVVPDLSGSRLASSISMFGGAASGGSPSERLAMRTSFVRELRIMLEGVWGR